jgi:hypothetical protein
MDSRTKTTSAGALAISTLLVTGVTHAQRYTAWEPATAVSALNVAAPVNDGCPIESRDGLSLYMASNRTGTTGGNDIWVADRLSKAARWGAPVNLGAPINTAANDFCPTPIGGHWLLFVSEVTGPDTCASGPGVGDMYLAHRDGSGQWGRPVHLGCAETGDGPNTFGAEFSPSLVETAEGTFLYFSSNVQGTQDIYVSRLGSNGRFEPATKVEELSTAFDDRMPNVRRDGLEIVFSSTRNDLGGAGGQDVYTATRSSTSQPWSAPVNAGPSVNTSGNETRATISWDGRRLHFGRDGDIFVSERHRVRNAR